MTTIELVEKIVVPLFAALGGAILAFRYQRVTELKREKRSVLQVLMMFRNVGANEIEFIKMLNAVDVVYHNNRKVRELLHTFFTQTVIPMFHTKQHVETFYKMLHEMAKDCGYDKLTLHELRHFYDPIALELHYPNLNRNDAPVHETETTEVTVVK